MSLGFDFHSTQLSSKSRQQLTNITKAVKPGSKAAEARSGLLRLIETHCFDTGKGAYIPLADDVRLKGKLPTYSQHLHPSEFPTTAFPSCYFTNALSIPAGFGTHEFDQASVSEPKLRATNIGFVVVTIEYDCRTTEELEECLAWTRGGDGEFSRSRFAEVDRELVRFKEYRGYTIVFTGNRSLHFHLIFSTRHLENAPWDCSAEKRLTRPHSDLLHQADNTYWDTASRIFDSILQPSLSPDRSLCNLTQWRRSPWALRRLEEESVVLGLPTGIVIPQLVIHENIRTRASQRSQDFLVPPDFKPTHALPAKSRSKKVPPSQVDHEALLERLVECCHEEWGEYPRPADVRNDAALTWSCR